MTAAGESANRAVRFDVIAIDGGAGTGKTTSAARVADRLGFCYLDSGAVYRAIALALLEGGVESEDDPRVDAAAAAAPIVIRPEPRTFRVLLAGRDLGQELRAPRIGSLASRIAVRPAVRARVGELLRAAAGLGPLVVEGRDIGTVVFPDAVLKVFLTASLPVRADRRRGDLERQGIQATAEEVARDLAERDQRDSTRADAPLRRPDGALEIDTSACGIDDQVDAIVAGYRRVAERR